MDFKGATRLFQDKEFDGDFPVYEAKPGESVIPPDDTESNYGDEIVYVPPPNTGEPGNDDPSGDEGGDDTGGGGTGGRTRYVIDDVKVTTGIERTQYLDVNGKLITEDYRVHLKDQIKATLLREFSDLADFLRRWKEAERKQAVIDELKEQGIPLEVLREAVPDGAKIDAFDLVAHIAFDQPPLTRKERANKVKKRNYFGKYGDEARAVLEALLDGITNIEDSKILELPPFSKLGSKTQIRRGIFGSNENYSQALTDLENAIYEELSA
jgi:type I restriction enzyme R subunit